MEENRNPKMVVDAVIDGGKEEKKDEKVLHAYPMTIRRYALLEKLESPFVGGDRPFTVENIVPAAYVMSTCKEKLREYASCDASKLVQDAFDWSEELGVEDIPSLVENLTRQLQDMNKAAPDAAPAEKKS